MQRDLDISGSFTLPMMGLALHLTVSLSFAELLQAKRTKRSGRRHKKYEKKVTIHSRQTRPTGQQLPLFSFRHPDFLFASPPTRRRRTPHPPFATHLPDNPIRSLSDRFDQRISIWTFKPCPQHTVALCR